MNKILLFMFLCLSMPLFAKDKYDRAVDLAVFKSKISGSMWTFQWNGNAYLFELQKDGKVTKIITWDNTTWEISGINEVTLKRGNSRMYLFFNEDVSSYSTLDWYGNENSGKKINFTGK